MGNKKRSEGQENGATILLTQPPLRKTIKTTFYLVRHEGPEEAALNLTGLCRRQAELTRDFLAIRPIDGCYASPSPGVMKMASILAAAHDLQPRGLNGLMEPGKEESSQSLQARVQKTMEELFRFHSSQNLLLVVHHLVHGAYMGHLLGRDGESLNFNHCGISVLVREDSHTRILTLNSVFHLQGLGI